MWGLRGQLSLLLAHGHPRANEYPVGLLWEESQLVVERVNRQQVTEAVILHQIMMTAVSAFGKDGGRRANKNFEKMIKELGGND